MKGANLFLNTIKRDKVKQKIVSQFEDNYNSESPDFVLQEKEFLDKLEESLEINWIPENIRQSIWIKFNKEKRF